MEDSVEVKSLRSVRDKLQKKLDTLTAEANKIREDYDKVITSARSYRSKIAQMDATITMLGGGTPDYESEEPVVMAVESILAQKPMHLRDIQNAVVALGYSAHSVRKALTGVSFKRLGRGEYALRDAIYAESANAK